MRIHRYRTHAGQYSSGSNRLQGPVGPHDFSAIRARKHAPLAASRFFVIDQSHTLYILDKATKEFTPYIDFDQVFPKFVSKTGNTPGVVSIGFDLVLIRGNRLCPRLRLQARAQGETGMNVLVDTSIWSLALRRKSEHLSAAERSLVAELSELIREGRARLIGLVRQELLSGIRTTEQYESLRLRLRSFPDEPIDTSDQEEAAGAGNRCRGKGIVVSIVDILLCAVVMKREWAIFTSGPDFTNYAKVLPLTIHTPRK